MQSLSVAPPALPRRSQPRLGIEWCYVTARRMAGLVSSQHVVAQHLHAEMRASPLLSPLPCWRRHASRRAATNACFGASQRWCTKVQGLTLEACALFISATDRIFPLDAGGSSQQPEPAAGAAAMAAPPQNPWTPPSSGRQPGGFKTLQAVYVMRVRSVTRLQRSAGIACAAQVPCSNEVC